MAGDEGPGSGGRAGSQGLRWPGLAARRERRGNRERGEGGGRRWRRHGPKGEKGRERERPWRSVEEEEDGNMGILEKKKLTGKI